MCTLHKYIYPPDVYPTWLYIPTRCVPYMTIYTHPMCTLHDYLPDVYPTWLPTRCVPYMTTYPMCTLHDYLPDVYPTWLYIPTRCVPYMTIYTHPMCTLHEYLPDVYPTWQPTTHRALLFKLPRIMTLMCKLNSLSELNLMYDFIKSTFFHTLDTKTPQTPADQQPTFHFSPFTCCRSVFCRLTKRLSPNIRMLFGVILNNHSF